jgi:hypothetical protein
MADITALIGALKGLWWPIAAVIIAAVYKAEFRLLLPRLRRAGPTGVEFDPAGQQQAAQAATVANNPAPGQLREFPGMVRTPAIERLERQLHTQLSAITNLSEDEKRDLLVRILAQAQLEAAFERIYNIIFGSQIAFLRRLNGPALRLSVEDAHSFFEPYARQFPQIYANFTFNQWLDFLKNVGLVTQNGDLIEITDLGRDFLVYITARGRIDQKPG